MAKIASVHFSGNPIGAILPSSAAQALAGTLLCDGAAVSRTTYSGLFAIIGTQYGSGDGSTTFNVPDLRWKFLRGHGANISVTGTGTAASNNATFTSHGFNRTGVKVRLSSGTLSGLSTSTDYYTIFIDANTLAFATSIANALAGTKVAISGANSAVIVQYEDSSASTRQAQHTGGNSGASLGTHQQDAMQGHTHQFTTYDIFNAVGPHLGANMNAATTPTTRTTNSALAADTTSGSPRTSGEVRPTNVATNYCIVYS
jgi:microcystin-dependent protein